MLDGLSWFHMYSVPLLRKTLWMARQREREQSLEVPLLQSYTVFMEPLCDNPSFTSMM